MNQDDDMAQGSTRGASGDPAGAGSAGMATESDAPVDHDPTLKWILTDFSDAPGGAPPLENPGATTPPPLPPMAKEQTPPPLPLSARTPPPLVRRPSPVPPTETPATTRIPQYQTTSERPPSGVGARDAAALIEAAVGATPINLFAVDSTPAPAHTGSPEVVLGAAPVAVLHGATAGSDSELSADAVELLPSTAEDSAPEVSPVPPEKETVRTGSTREAVKPGASLQPRPAAESSADPHEVEPEAVEMLESAEHQTITSVAQPPKTPLAPTPPPVPVESAARAITPPRPSTIAAALFEEYETPVVGGDPIPEALARRSLQKRAKPWYEEVFDEDFLRTLPFMTPEQTGREIRFIREALCPPKGGEVLDVGCGYGRHALELAQQGLRMTGLDLSLPMLIRAADNAQKRGLSVNFVHADMREMNFNGQFDAAYCVLSSFGYFDEETNLRVASSICRALKPGGRFLLDIINRDYIVGDLPSRVWWEGDGCVVLEEVDFNYHTSRVLIRRSVVFGNGRQSEQEISMRAYSLHEVGKLLRQAGLRVLDVSGGLGTKSRFFGSASRNIMAICERPAP